MSAHLSVVYESEQARITEVQKSLSRTTDKNERQGFRQITPWMRRTQWFDTYRGAQRDVLLKMTTFPSYESRRWGLRLGVVDGVAIRTEAFAERQLELILAAIDCLFDRCEETYHSHWATYPMLALFPAPYARIPTAVSARWKAGKSAKVSPDMEEIYSFLIAALSHRRQASSVRSEY